MLQRIKTKEIIKFQTIKAKHDHKRYDKGEDRGMRDSEISSQKQPIPCSEDK